MLFAAWVEGVTCGVSDWKVWYVGVLPPSAAVVSLLNSVSFNVCGGGPSTVSLLEILLMSHAVGLSFYH